MARATPISAAPAVADSTVLRPVRRRPRAVPASVTATEPEPLPRPGTGPVNLYETALEELFGDDSYLRRQRSLMAWLHRR